MLNKSIFYFTKLIEKSNNKLSFFIIIICFENEVYF